MEETKFIERTEPLNGETEDVVAEPAVLRSDDENARVHWITDDLRIHGTEEQVTSMFQDFVGYFGEIENPENTAVNTFFNGSKYAPLNEVLNTVRPVMAKHGLAITQITSCNKEDGCTVTTMLMHKNGAYIIYPALVAKPADTKNAVQGIGATLTYLRRFALNAVAAVCGEVDDDGNTNQSASTSKSPKKEQTPHQKVASVAKDKSKKNRAKVAEIIKEAAGTDLIKDIPENKIEEVLKKLEELN